MQALQRTKILLKKAQKLIDLIESNEELGAPERDLMRSYLRDLHDIFIADTEYLTQNNTSETSAPPPIANVPPPRQEPPPPAAAHPKNDLVFPQITEKEEVMKDNAPPTSSAQNTWDTLYDAAERFLELHDTAPKTPAIDITETEMPPLVAENVKPSLAEPKTPIPTKNYVSDNHEDDAMPVVLAPIKTTAVESEKKSGAALIFDIKSASDMGADTPIKDFRLAFGLNERIFNINELFGGSASVYDAVLNELNQMSAFDDAKAFLEQKIIGEYGWEKPEKVKKAQWFVRLLWRRFL